MMKQPQDILSEATRLLQDFDCASDPEQKVQKFESGVNLINAYVEQNSDRREDARRQIQELRNAYARKLLTLLSDVRDGSTEGWLASARNLLFKMKPEIDRVRADYYEYAKLFPQPPDGSAVEISPPGLAWLPMKGATRYRVEIRDGAGVSSYKKEVGNSTVHLPDEALPPGFYTWDAIAVDAAGVERICRGPSSFTIAEGAPELPWVEPRNLLARVPGDHPRFVYLRQDLPAIRATLGTTRRRSWEACLRAAEQALQAPLPIYPTHHLAKSRLEAQLGCQRYAPHLRRSVSQALMPLSLAFLMTGESKYAQAAKRILLPIADWPTGDSDVTSVSAAWGDEPGLILASCAHRAYDWLYDALSEPERAKVLRMCEARAWQIYRRLVRYNYLTYPGESHNGRLVPYLAEMAIVMAGQAEGAERWLDYSLKALATIFPHWGGQEGGWAEGMAYALYYNTWYIPAIESLRAAMGFDLWKRPFFRKVRYFFFYCSALGGEMTPFGDNAESPGPGTDDSGYRRLLWHHAHRFNDPYIGWWVNQVNDDPKGGFAETSLLFEDSAKMKVPIDLPDSRVFWDVGWAALHSNLKQPKQDAFLLFKSSPYGSASHSHADQNSFCIMKGGKALAIPSGYYGPLAGLPHHTEWTCSTRANNCVLVNGEGQAIRERRARGRISAFEYRTKWSYVVGDAAAAYMGKLRRFDRHILFLPPSVFLLLDDLEAPEAASFQWLLHALEKMDLDDTTGRVISRRKGAVLDVRVRSPFGLKLSQTDRFGTPYNAGVPREFQKSLPEQWHLTADTVRKGSSVRIGAVMAIRGPGEVLKLESFEVGGWFGAEARGAFGRVEGWMQLQPYTPGPDRYNEAVAEGKAKLCGMAANGDRFVGSKPN